MTSYDDAMRTIIDLTTSQIDALDRWRKREGVSRAEAIRRAVTAHVQGHAQDDARQAFGLWKARPVEALAYQEKRRREWNARTPSRGRRR